MLVFWMTTAMRNEEDIHISKKGNERVGAKDWRCMETAIFDKGMMEDAERARWSRGATIDLI